MSVPASEAPAGIWIHIGAKPADDDGSGESNSSRGKVAVSVEVVAATVDACPANTVPVNFGHTAHQAAQVMCGCLALKWLISEAE